jgi:TRAP-type mannitol/chloroaromatic compound transport system permease large subunit
MGELGALIIDLMARRPDRKPVKETLHSELVISAIVIFNRLFAQPFLLSFLTPPFGWALFFLKGVAPPGVTTRDIYVGAIPFVLLQLLALVVIFQFPLLVTWLPDAIGW